jgi:hypothetical protein
VTIVHDAESADGHSMLNDAHQQHRAT